MVFGATVGVAFFRSALSVFGVHSTRDKVIVPLSFTSMVKFPDTSFINSVLVVGRLVIASCEIVHSFFVDIIWSRFFMSAAMFVYPSTEAK